MAMREHARAAEVNGPVGPATPHGHRNSNSEWEFPFPLPGRWGGKKKIPDAYLWPDHGIKHWYVDQARDWNMPETFTINYLISSAGF